MKGKESRAVVDLRDRDEYIFSPENEVRTDYLILTIRNDGRCPTRYHIATEPLVK